MIDRLPGPAYPHTQAVELVAPQRRDDVAQAVVAAGRATAPQADLAEREVHVIGDHQEL